MWYHHWPVRPAKRQLYSVFTFEARKLSCAVLPQADDRYQHTQANGWHFHEDKRAQIINFFQKNSTTPRYTKAQLKKGPLTLSWVLLMPTIAHLLLCFWIQNSNHCLMWWLLLLQRFNTNSQYIKGTDNIIADFLWRSHCSIPKDLLWVCEWKQVEP